MDLDIEVADANIQSKEKVESPRSIESSSQEEEDVVEELPEHQPFDNSYTMRTEIEGMNRSVYKSKSGKKKPSSHKK